MCRTTFLTENEEFESWVLHSWRECITADIPAYHQVDEAIQNIWPGFIRRDIK
jgi:hypothetical protein